MKFYLEERGSKNKKMGKKKARVRAGIPKFQDAKRDKSLERAGYTPDTFKQVAVDDADKELMLCIGADDFKFDYTTGGICVMTTAGCIDKSLKEFKKVDAKVGVRTIKKSKAKDVMVGEVGRDPKWHLSLAKMKKFIESYTPEQLWDMEDGDVWQEWIDTITHYYFLKSHVSGQAIAVCDPLKSMRNVIHGDGDSVIAQQVSFKKPTESTVPKHPQ